MPWVSRLGTRSIFWRPQLKLATIGLGYADGYHRVLSGKSEVAIDGQICPIVGRVSMDLVTLDVRLSQTSNGERG